MEMPRTGPVCRSRWVWFAQRHQNAGPSSLGELGWQSQDDPPTTTGRVRCLSGLTDLQHFRAAGSFCAHLRASGDDVPEWGAFSTALPRHLDAFCPGMLWIPGGGWQQDTSVFTEQRSLNTAVIPSVVPSAGRDTPITRWSSLGLPCHHFASSASCLQRFDPAFFFLLQHLRVWLRTFPFAVSTSFTPCPGSATHRSDAPFAIDATLVSPLRADGDPHSRCLGWCCCG